MGETIYSKAKVHFCRRATGVINETIKRNAFVDPSLFLLCNGKQKKYLKDTSNCLYAWSLH